MKTNQSAATAGLGRRENKGGKMLSKSAICAGLHDLGARNLADGLRSNNDYYATDPHIVEELLKVETIKGSVWENSCGAGHISKVLVAHGLKVISTDLIYRGYGKGGIDFLACTKTRGDNIVMNPPFSLAREFIDLSLKLIKPGKKIYIFLKLGFISSVARRSLFISSPPKVIYALSRRVGCAKNGDPKEWKKKGMDFAWFVWEKGYKGITILKWIN